MEYTVLKTFIRNRLKRKHMDFSSSKRQFHILRMENELIDFDQVQGQAKPSSVDYFDICRLCERIRAHFCHSTHQRNESGLNQFIFRRGFGNEIKHM